MDIVLNIIGGIIACIVFSVATQFSLISLLHQVPIVHSLSRKRLVAFTQKNKLKYIGRLAIFIALVVAVYFISSVGVLIGAAIGLLVGIRAAFDGNNKNDSFVYIIEEVTEEQVLDEYSWEIFTVTVNSIERLQKELSDVIVREKNGMSHFPLSSAQKSKVLQLTEESNHYFRQSIQCNIHLRDMLLKSELEEWEAMAERNLDVVDELSEKMRKVIEARDVILKESLDNKGA